MIDIASALYQFFSGFDIPAFVDGSVPSNQALPYITYRLIKPDWQDNVQLPARIWYRSPSWREAAEKAQEISRAIGNGYSMQVGDGCLVLYRDSNFSQAMTDDTDDMIKIMYLSLIINAYTT